MSLFPVFDGVCEGPALVLPEAALSYPQLRDAAAELAARLPAEGPLALWASAERATVVALLAGLSAGVTLIPLSPKAGRAELAHILADARPRALLAPAGVAIDGLETISPSATPPPASALPLPAAASRATALIVYTSGTTGPPKGVLLSVAAIAANLDALAEAWQWSAADLLVHALPLFHVHGLVLGTLGPLRLGGRVRHLGAFDPAAVAAALAGEATMLFAVPTMYHRLADAAEEDPAIAEGLRGARLLVSGSAALPGAEHARIERLSGQRVVERYGMSETLMITAVRADGERRAGYVGRPLGAVELRVVDDAGRDLPADDASIGDVVLRSPSIFDGYLNLPEASAAAFRDGWFVTGDLGTLAPDGYLRLAGRRSTDLIKSGGYRIGAGEIESALLEHRAVAEAAVRGLDDPDLGERIVAWVVLRADASVGADELIDHVASLLSAHKRPREVRFVAELPRNALGKLQKHLLPA
jgi:acyl-CoA synthetase (AMP-forming)/AMP-acid ligase II